MNDRLHQPARATLLPWLPALLAEARAAGAAGAALSGAGTPVGALCAPEMAPAVVRALSQAAASQGVPGRSEVVEVGVPGARVAST
jgi:homoserine kinase